MPRRQSSPLPSDMSNRSLKDEVEVSIVDFETGERLPQIHVSKTQLTHLVRSNRHVIFSTAEQRFGIQITVHAAFDWGDANALQVTLGFDQGNTVNEKRVFLIRPTRNVKTSNLETDNALLKMWSQGSELTCCIDQLLIQDPTACEGRVNAFSFVFSDVCKSDELVPSTQREKPRSLEKVGDHQGKIRVEVTRKVIRAGAQRLPGLHDNLTGRTRPATQTLLKHGISLEIRLDEFKNVGSLDYGSAFRPAVCKPTSQHANLIFEFLYRNTNLLDEIVYPEFRAEIADHPSFYASDPVQSHPGLEIGASAARSFCIAADGGKRRMVDVDPEFSSQLVETLGTASTSVTMVDSGNRHGEVGSHITTTTLTSPTDAPDVTDPWRQIEEALKKCEDLNREQEEEEQKDVSVLRDELALLYNWESETSTDLLRRRLQLTQDEEQLHQEFTQRKDEVEVKLAQLERRRSTREASLAAAAEVFLSSLCELEKRKARA